MRFCILSSGSRANCTFIEAGSSRFLIDCGLSATQAEKRLRMIGIDPESIDAVLITHEHRDHVHGVPVWSRRHKVCVYANRGARDALTEVRGINEFKTGQIFVHNDIEILPFSISHDAADPVGFRFDYRGYRFAQVTDIGQITANVREALRGCQALVVESNHDEDMLRGCDYPWVLKQRILSSHGHLSNENCGELLSSVMHDDLINVVLGHISENSNTPQMALQTVSRYLPKRLTETLGCASIHMPTPFYTVGEKEVSKWCEAV